MLISPTSSFLSHDRQSREHSPYLYENLHVDGDGGVLGDGHHGDGGGGDGGHGGYGVLIDAQFHHMFHK